MSRTIAAVVLRFVALLLAQVLILNNINLFGYVEPMIYVWFILLLPVGTPKWLVLLLSFLVGFCVDIFSGQVGFHTAVATFTGFARPLFLNSVASNQQTTDFDIPSSATMGLVPFLIYVSVLTFVHVFLLIAIETFRWSEVLPMLLRIALSAVASILLIVICDLIFFARSSGKNK